MPTFPNDTNYAQRALQKLEAVFRANPEYLNYCLDTFGASQARTTITNGYPEAGGGGASCADTACANVTNDTNDQGDDDDGGGDDDGEDDCCPSDLSPPPSNGLAPFNRGKQARTPATTGNPSQAPLKPEPEQLLRLRSVLDRVQVSRAHWYDGIKKGRYPAPIKITERISVWRNSDISRLVAELSASA